MHCAEIACFFGRVDSGVCVYVYGSTLSSPAFSTFCLASVQLCDCIKDGAHSQFSSSHMSKASIIWLTRCKISNRCSICVLKIKADTRYIHTCSRNRLSIFYENYCFNWERLSSRSGRAKEVIPSFYMGYNCYLTSYFSKNKPPVEILFMMATLYM